MGNHEYCTRCGASDYHRGQSCEEAYPEQLKQRQNEQAALDRRTNEARKKLQTLRRQIEKHFGITAREEEHQLTISLWEAEKINTLLLEGEF